MLLFLVVIFWLTGCQYSVLLLTTFLKKQVLYIFWMKFRLFFYRTYKEKDENFRIVSHFIIEESNLQDDFCCMSVCACEY